MTRIVALLALLLAVSVPAAAQGIHLRWGDCASGGGATNAAFACNTNLATHALATSFVLDDTTVASAIIGTIDIVSASATLPEWWQFRGCRSGSLFTDRDFVPVDVCPHWRSVGCPDGISSYVVGVAGPNTARIEFAEQFCPSSVTLLPGIEYFGPVLVINSTRTLPSPSCAGCGTGVCLALTRLRVGTLEITTPALPDGNRVTWQGGGSDGQCDRVTPARRSAWSQVKALFR
jgi:hypothetical protein